MASQPDHIRQFIHHAKMLHRQEFPHENPMDMNNPSEQPSDISGSLAF
jgi:hypothetical protein